MIDLGILAVIIWIGCFVVISVDSVYHKIDPVFWRFAALFGGPFSLLVYAIIRERKTRQ
jgi:drug/metabolite transporter (DMT)-like permease